MIFKTSGGQNQLIKNLSNKQKGCSELPIAFKGECRKSRGFPGLSAVKNPPANVGNARDASLIPGWEDPLEKGMAAHSSTLA